MDSDEQTIARELVSRISNGDHSAEQELTERYSRGLMMLLRKRCADMMLAEDLHQDCLLVVITRLRERGLDQPEKLARFIHCTAKNKHIAHIRKQTSRKTHCDNDIIDNTSDNSLDPAASVDQDQVAQLTRQWLGELSVERDRILLTRHYLHQHDKAQICADLDIGSVHFNRVLYRARGRFGRLLEQGERRRHLRLVQ